MGAGVTGDGEGKGVLQVSTYSQLPLSIDPVPKLTLQHSMADPYCVPPRRNISLVHTPLMKKNR